MQVKKNEEYFEEIQTSSKFGRKKIEIGKHKIRKTLWWKAHSTLQSATTFLEKWLQTRIYFLANHFSRTNKKSEFAQPLFSNVKKADL